MVEFIKKPEGLNTSDNSAKLGTRGLAERGFWEFWKGTEIISSLVSHNIVSVPLEVP